MSIPCYLSTQVFELISLLESSPVDKDVCIFIYMFKKIIEKYNCSMPGHNPKFYIASTFGLHYIKWIVKVPVIHSNFRAKTVIFGIKSLGG